jgi:thioredoxin 1
MSSIFIHLENEDDFIKFTEECRVCVVDFFATWCGPCVKLGEELENLVPQNENIDVATHDDLENNLSEKVMFLKINVDEFGDLASLFKIRGIPHIIFFKNGKLQKQTVAGLNPDKVINIINELY